LPIWKEIKFKINSHLNVLGEHECVAHVLTASPWEPYAGDPGEFLEKPRDVFLAEGFGNVRQVDGLITV
tara:strand:+ start:348 stop:554 length:207 start_codon:yes stop_codon:yes gene_type:complete